MAENYYELVDLLRQTMNFLYKECAEERKEIHKIEWEEESSVSSVLGEVEVRSGSIIGNADKQIDTLLTSPGVIHDLERMSIYKSPTIKNWLVAEGINYPQLLRYIMAIENLRVVVVECLKGRLALRGN